MASRVMPASIPPEHRKVILASSVGALFEWYDFYLYGALAPLLAATFFADADPTLGLVAALLSLAAGFLVRPIGALYFGRLGDLIGRKYIFLVTLLLMGAATFLIGVLPGYATLGAAAPVGLVLLRLAQGLAIGGEYGGVVTYVAEHAARNRRGLYTGWIQTTASLGLLLALAVIVGVRATLGEAAFAEWGWRIPFLLSALLLAIGVWVRLSLRESPPFVRLKRAGGASRKPLTEAFGRWPNLKRVLIALFGLVAGQAVVWYTGQLQAFFFLTLQLKVDTTTASLLLCAALALGAPLFVLFGALSDRFGRKAIVLAGIVLAALTYRPLFEGLTTAANPALAAAQQQVPITLAADASGCAWALDPIGRAADVSSCDRAKRHLAERAARFTRVDASAPVAVTVGGQRIELGADAAEDRRRLDAALDAAGYPQQADPSRIDHLRVIGILWLLVLFVAMVYGPIAALLVEMFPTRVRCSSVSLPYHLGNGWFGGLLPSMMFAIAAHTGNLYTGLWYPVGVALASAAIGFIFLREPDGADLDAQQGSDRSDAPGSVPESTSGQ
ncbi:MAG TPA: MFS transporter [Burkholderiaceae bacterium]|nr:MFS transporter [Burkholderiaceae bacterium]